ncbi:MAG: TIGR03905 family TSCPD domain-containing protein [Anaerotignaceae bacterium]
MENSFTPKGVCAKSIDFEVDDNKIKSIQFHGGCPGNLIGIQTLVVGMEVEAVIDRLSGIKCGQKSTSCPDQLACALKNYVAQK